MNVIINGIVTNNKNISNDNDKDFFSNVGVKDVIDSVDSTVNYSKDEQNFKKNYIVPLEGLIQSSDQNLGVVKYSTFLSKYMLFDRAYNSSSEKIKKCFEKNYTGLSKVILQLKIAHNLRYIKKEGDTYYNYIVGYIKKLKGLDKNFDFQTFNNQFIDDIEGGLRGKEQQDLLVRK